MSLSLHTLPNLFLVGAPKAGTTSLYHYLDQHPQIYMSPIKEPNYFATEIRPHNLCEEFQAAASRDLQGLQEYLRGPMDQKRFGAMVTEWEDYLRLFQNVEGEEAIGEASVSYLWSKTAATNIHTAIPDAKIIMILRDPAERAFSQYLEAVANEQARSSFAEHVQKALVCKTEKFHLLHPFLECGLYYQQVKRYLDLFPEENVLILFYDQYQKQLAQSLKDIYYFLNVDPAFTAETSQRFLVPRVPRFSATMRFLRKYGVSQRVNKLSPSALRFALRSLAFKNRQSLVMAPEDRRRLIDYYQDDVRKLSDLLDRDLYAWLD